MDSNQKITAPLIGDIGSVASALLKEIGGTWEKPSEEWTGAVVLAGSLDKAR